MAQQSRPSIFRLPDPIKPVHRTPLLDMVSGPISPLERNPQSIKGWSIRESDGIGLGIVAALYRSDGCRRPETIADGTPTKCVSAAPISIGSPRDEQWCNVRRCGGVASASFHGPKDGGLFCWSPPRITDDLRAFRPAEFLSNCCLCRKRLDGMDIYMYRGEKAFCSMECRCQQISIDEFQEKCGAEARGWSEVSRPSYENDHRLFFMGIAAS